MGTFLLALSTTALAVPTTIHHQGRMMDSAGTPISGAESVVFRLYDAQPGGNPV